MAFLSDLLGPRAFQLAEFELAPLDFSGEITCELAELLLDQPIAPQGESSTVVPFPQPIPTPGEMRQRIERHLETRDEVEPGAAPASPAEELRLALAELRRSLG